MMARWNTLYVATGAGDIIVPMEYSLFDSHCHPQFPQYDQDREEVIERALSQGIGMICVGTDLETSRSAILLAEQYEGLYASVGLHPNDALEESHDERVYSGLVDGGNGNVVAVGEIGLDYYRTQSPDLQRRQRERFESQLDMAAKKKLPVIIHCRDAHRDMREVLSLFRYSKLSGVIHSFTGTWIDAQAYIGLGFHIGFNGIITFARDYDKTVKNVPLERILLETDAPYLTPIPHRGKRNEPSYIIEVARKIAQIRNITLDELEGTTMKSVRTMFI